MRNIICLIILFSCQLINAQKHDKSWVIGYNNNRHPTHKGTLMTFNNNNMMTMSPRLVETNVGIGSNTSICDSSGNLAFFSNGYTIWNKNSEVIHERLVFSNWFNDVTYGNYLACSNLFLPMPNQPNQYVLLSLTPSTNEFHFKDIPIYVAADSLQYTILDATGNGGRGTVSSLKQMLFVDTLDSEGVSACRHANGRDWWIFAAEDASNRFYRYLLDPRGIRYHGEQRIGDSVNYKYSFAHTVFSPNGEWWIRRRANSYGNGVGYDIYLYRFDRCNGQLYNPIHLQYPTDTSTGGGVAISPNSRYLYVTTNKIIHQYDLQAANIAMSKQTIGVWDGFADTLGWQTKFLYMQLAPDNKIYISTVPTTKFLHVIHAPDSAGVACRLQQRAVELFTYNRTLPFLPNYRTGRLVGSPCDTVSVATEEVDTGGGAVSVFPNPAQGVVTFSWQSLFNPPEGGRLILFDVSGKAVLQQQILGGSTETSIDVSTLPNGMYLYKIQFGDSVQQGKIVVAR